MTQVIFEFYLTSCVSERVSVSNGTATNSPLQRHNKSSNNSTSLKNSRLRSNSQALPCIMAQPYPFLPMSLSLDRNADQMASLTLSLRLNQYYFHHPQAILLLII
jgi:hypothetical protein